MSSIAKHCPGCGAGFTVEALVSDPRVKPLGMLLDAYLFDHRCCEAGAMFSVPVESFDPLVAKSQTVGLPMLADGCEGRCINLDDQAPCAQPCVAARYRTFLVDVLLRDRSPTH